MRATLTFTFFLLMAFLSGCQPHASSFTSAPAAATPDLGQRDIVSQRPRSQTPQEVHAGGNFRSPGNFPWTNGITAADVVHQAGGLTDFATPWLVIVHRDGSREKYLLTWDLQITNDIPLQPGDHVFNPRQ
jgi:protein involved in polysaccharide export with SLBB domain